MEALSVPPEKTRPARGAAARLKRDDWLDAAFDAAVEHGFDGVRVLVLADTLGVTRGSFYWHFKDHAELIAALLERWRASETQSNAQMQEPASTDPVKDLEILLDVALAHGGVELRNMRFELALRALGRRDAAVAEMLRKVDQARLTMVAGKFARIAPDTQTATDLAVLFYVAVVGSFQALARAQTSHPSKQYLQEIIGRYLVRQQAK